MLDAGVEHVPRLSPCRSNGCWTGSGSCSPKRIPPTC